uniref:neurexin-1-beta-like n=1 Tax=Myxine glutinosa TaxID=7769 RepID=UPI00358F7033
MRSLGSPDLPGSPLSVAVALALLGAFACHPPGPPAPLRTRGGPSVLFLEPGGLLLYTWPVHGRPSTRADRLTVWFATLASNAVMVRIDSAPSLGDFLELRLENGHVSLTFNVGTGNVQLEDQGLPADGQHHVVTFWRRGGNATLQVDRNPPVHHSPQIRQLTIFNSQASIRLGGQDQGRPYFGLIWGFYYNGLKVINLAAAGNHMTSKHGHLRVIRGRPPALASVLEATVSTLQVQTSTSWLESTEPGSTNPPTSLSPSPISQASAEEEQKNEKDGAMVHLALAGVRDIQGTDDLLVASAECPTDDEDLEECQMSSDKMIAFSATGERTTARPAFDEPALAPAGNMNTQGQVKGRPEALSTIRQPNPAVATPAALPEMADVPGVNGGTTGMVAGIGVAAALCVAVLLFAMSKHQGRDNGASRRPKEPGKEVRQDQELRHGEQVEGIEDKEYFV